MANNKMANNDAFLVSAKRTPVGRYGGALSAVRPDDLAALTIKAVLEDTGLETTAVDEVIYGNANGAGEENRNVARMAWLLAGGDESVPECPRFRLPALWCNRDKPILSLPAEWNRCHEHPG